MFANVAILNRIAETITVGDICSPFIGQYSPSDSGSDVRQDWDSKLSNVRHETPFDHIGLVLKDGVPVGTIGYESLEEERNIWATMDKLSWRSVVGGETPLIEAAKLFGEKSPFVFLVLRRNELTGWMSYYHLLGIPFRACLFALFLALEQAMLDVVATTPSLAVSKLRQSRLDAAKRVYLARGHELDKVGEPSPRLLLECTHFIDKATIIGECASTASAIPAVTDKAVNKAEKIRNSLAHPTRDAELVMLLPKNEIHGFLASMQRLDNELAQFLNSGSTLSD